MSDWSNKSIVGLGMNLGGVVVLGQEEAGERVCVYLPLYFLIQNVIMHLLLTYNTNK